MKTKVKLSNESINLLIERASGDRGNLRNEIDKLISKENFSEEVDRYVNFFKSAKPIKNNEDVYIPGEIENNTKIDRTKNGIPMTKTTWDTISITSDEYKIDTKLRDDCVI